MLRAVDPKIFSGRAGCGCHDAEKLLDAWGVHVSDENMRRAAAEACRGRARLDVDDVYESIKTAVRLESLMLGLHRDGDQRDKPDHRHQKTDAHHNATT
jgi:hypothetical protein